MDFVIQWLWYLLAFVAGSAAAWGIANVVNKRASNETTPSDSTASGRGEQQ
jgi:uncharacterized membrane protein ArfB